MLALCMYVDKLVSNKGKEYQIKNLLVKKRNLFYLVEHDGEHYVAKCAGEQERVWMENEMGVTNEINILKIFNGDGGHPNITNIIDYGRYGDNEESVFFIMPYMGPELEKWASIDQTGHDPLKLLALYKIAQGIEFFHDKGYVHGDIKPSNMLLKSQVDFLGMKPEDCDSVLIDFELCHKPGYFKTREGRVTGTEFYMSPERLKGEADLGSDIYGFGVSILYLLIGEKFDDEADKNPFRIHEVKISDFGKKVPKKLEKLLKECLAPKAGKRPVIYKVKKKLKEILESKYGLPAD
jgi:serine/threonine protein kinase